MNYDRKIPLGDGQYGYVFLGTFSGQKVAVKRILKGVDPEDEDEAVRTREETAMKKLMEHENVLKLIHVEEDDNFK